MEIDALILQGSSEALDEDVVHPAASAIHADAHLGIAQDAGEREAGKLAALGGGDTYRSHRTVAAMVMMAR
jgi:hypothetical protein